MQHTGDKSAIILLSGGLDSLVSLAKANKFINIKLALTFDYGQQSNKREILACRKITKFYGLKHLVLELPWLKDITKTALVNKEKNVPKFSIKDLNDKKKTFISAKNVWVPNRNAVFINIAASFAESFGYKVIITGFNKEEASTFPDNSLEFVNAINKSLMFSTLNKVMVISPTQLMNKEEIVKLGFKLRAPFKYVYSCYLDSFNGKMCGRCESCRRLQRAFRKVNSYNLIAEKFETNGVLANVTCAEHQGKT